jgi:hypothetical protein
MVGQWAVRKVVLMAAKLAASTAVLSVAMWVDVMAATLAASRAIWMVDLKVGE